LPPPACWQPWRRSPSKPWRRCLLPLLPRARAPIRLDRGRGGSLERTTALFSAADAGCAPLALRLLDAGATLDARNRFGTMPLAHAAHAGRVRDERQIGNVTADAEATMALRSRRSQSLF
jgi:hypothetical protein